MPKPMTRELKPCPFQCCNGKATLSDNGFDWWVNCIQCELTTPVFESEAQAVEFWNTRALPDIEPLDENNLVEYLWERFGFRDIDCLDDWRTIVKAICQRFSKLQLTQEEFESYLPKGILPEKRVATPLCEISFNKGRIVGFNSAIQQAKENFKRRGHDQT